MGFLYRLDFPNGKSYVGITTGSVERRFRGHKKAASDGKKTLLYKAWRKYGDPFVVVIAEIDDSLLCDQEIKAIKEFSTLMPNGYNMTVGGEVSPMTIPEVVAEFSRSKIGHRPCDKAFEEAIKATKGKKRPPEVVQKMSENGSMRRPETRAKQAATLATKECRARFSCAAAVVWAKKQGREFCEIKKEKQK